MSDPSFNPRQSAWIGATPGLLLLLGCGFPVQCLSAAEAAETKATITVDAAVVVNTFRPVDVFGVNMVPYVNKADYAAVQGRLQELGTVFVRYPSGIADDVHWNGAGAFDGRGWWVPNQTNYAPSFQGIEIHRGTTSHYGRPAMVTDGDPATYWLSDAGADAPTNQWLYVDLGATRTADAVSIAWGTPYATRFSVQFWNPKSINQWAPYSHTADDWMDTSARNISGVGGTQQVTFASVASRYFRLLLTASSASPPQYAVAELAVFNQTNRLTQHSKEQRQDPADANWKPMQSWTVASTTDPACSVERPYDFDFETFMGYVRGLSPRVSPLITINCGGATPEEAAAWVRYANLVKGYGIRYWEIGNEMNGSWETGGPLGAREYAARYLAFYRAMKAVDPRIVIAGPGISDAVVPSGDYDGRSYLQAFVERLAARNQAGAVEAVDVHWYPFFMNDNRETTWKTVGQLSALPAQFDRWLAPHPRAATVPILVSEFNSGAGTPFSTRIENALWLADTLGEFIRGFGRRGAASYWTVLHPCDAAANPRGGDQSLLQLENNAWRYQERSVYWAMELLSTRWAVAADLSQHTLVQAVSTQPLLSVYADRRPDGILSLLVVNRDLNHATETQLILKHFVPASKAVRWTFDQGNYRWNTNAAPFHAEPDQSPSSGMETGIGPSFRYRFPPASITVFQLPANERKGQRGGQG